MLLKEDCGTCNSRDRGGPLKYGQTNTSVPAATTATATTATKTTAKVHERS